ncbi:MAG: hypothetical protein A3C88_01230 [Candidatus Yanofskybacteria bacterium RIFCSPHIGHO2_02_FULL_50_12]|uniref:Uncharacterized protein n=1 Tax=Candidatus Yanofskybacteria bacterium RIFCSPHIGHO2_02_FULL_50_12 TaxID=1802685 RepID=A0A1F8FTD5_9BACT|nr:MAG: hypothetical protein A3C88_01230 [Candidatus Yanofskybacteria bacterium RIFCSPHIGHO2_02_FULL_50_12]
MSPPKSLRPPASSGAHKNSTEFFARSTEIPIIGNGSAGRSEPSPSRPTRPRSPSDAGGLRSWLIKERGEYEDKTPAGRFICSLQ